MSSEIKRGPISPGEALELKNHEIPEEVFVAFNSLIARNLNYGTAIVRQDDVIESLVEQGNERKDIFANHWLDVEDSYRAIGWKVLYDKPGYNESYDAFFEFHAPKGVPKLVQEYY